MTQLEKQNTTQSGPAVGMQFKLVHRKDVVPDGSVHVDILYRYDDKRAEGIWAVVFPNWHVASLLGDGTVKWSLDYAPINISITNPSYRRYVIQQKRFDLLAPDDPGNL